MSQSKKYQYRMMQVDNGWAVEILRRASSKKTVVSKRQDGFATEPEAQEWGEKEVKLFLQKYNLNEQNKRRAQSPG